MVRMSGQMSRKNVPQSWNSAWTVLDNQIYTLCISNCVRTMHINAGHCIPCHVYRETQKTGRCIGFGMQADCAVRSNGMMGM